MNSRAFRRELDDGKIHNQYLLISSEPLLIDNAIKSIQKKLNANEAFDCNTYRLSDTPREEIISQLYMTAFTSEKRLIIVKNLEEIDKKTLADFAKMISEAKSPNCLVMTYIKAHGERITRNFIKKLTSLFTTARSVHFQTDKSMVHKWVNSKIERDGLELSPTVRSYLEDEFNNDVTGLKNEFEKIENYLYETQSLSDHSIRALAKGLCDFDKYHVVDAFFQDGNTIIQQFEELSPFLHSYAEIVDALTRGLIYRTRKAHKQYQSIPNPSIRDMLNNISLIDRAIKRGSYFAHIFLELFFLRNSRASRKGANYG